MASAHEAPNVCRASVQSLGSGYGVTPLEGPVFSMRQSLNTTKILKHCLSNNLCSLNHCQYSGILEVAEAGIDLRNCCETGGTQVGP